MSTRVPLRDKIFLPLINFLLRVLTSKQYRKRLDRVIRLGMLKAMEVHAQRQAADVRLANEPGMNPDGTIVFPEEA